MFENSPQRLASIRTPNRCLRLAAPLLALIAALFISASVRAAEIPADSPIAGAVKKADAAVAKIVAIPHGERTFENTILAIDDLLVTFDNDTSMTQFMFHVSTDAAERDAGQVAEEHWTSWLIDLYTRQDLFDAVKAYADTKPKLEGEHARLLKFIQRDFRRAGMELSPEKREELKAVQQEMTKLQLDFAKNVATDDTRVPLMADQLEGVPQTVIDAQPHAGPVILLGMDYPSFLPTMDFCKNENTRAMVWVAYKRRGGEQNVTILEKILKLRAREAELLGYDSEADYRIEVRMAKNAKRVKQFFDELRPLVRVKAQQDYDELQQMKRVETGKANAVLQPWDQSYYINRAMETKYAVDSERVREYLPMERVMEGLFSITQSLYGLEYKDITDKAGTTDRPLWHEDVKLYEVWDKASKEKLGEFYLDLYPRENKFSHAAQWGLRPRKVWQDGTVQKPLAALVCNFTKPTANKPSLLSHDEVETFFHEFGHCLHTILTTATIGRFAGTSVEDDFVEAPSQMFEEWVWSKDVLQTFAKHYETNQPIPDDLVNGMLNARNLASGLLREHQYYYALTDLAYHMVPGGSVDTTKVALDLFGEVELYKPVPNTFYQASFGHLVNPGYVAGYYGYEWSRVFACDMATRFRELGMLNPEAGAYYRQKIISRGGTVDAMDMLRDYLGREPNMDAYLDYIGLKRERTTSN